VIEFPLRFSAECVFSCEAKASHHNRTFFVKIENNGCNLEEFYQVKKGPEPYVLSPSSSLKLISLASHFI